MLWSLQVYGLVVGLLMSTRRAVAWWVGLPSSLFGVFAVRLEIAMTTHFETCVEASALWRRRQPTRPAAEPVFASTVNNTKSAGEVRFLPLHTTVPL